MSTTHLPPPPARPGGEPLGPLAARLATADRTLQKERGWSRLLRSWPWVAGFVAACFAADVILHLAAVPRAALSVAFLLLVAGLVGGFGWIALSRRNSYEHTARVLESRHARLGSKLINILQLRAQTQDEALAPLTRQLAGAAIDGYADELRDEPLEQLARTGIVRREAKRTGWALLGALVLGGIFFNLTRTEVLRFVDPFGDHPPYSFTRLEISDPGDDATQVVFGQNVMITARASGHRPGELFLTHHPIGKPELAVTVPMFDKGERGFTQQIEGIKSETIVVAHTKNRHSLSKQRRIGVVLTPRLESAFVKIAPPAYTALAPREQPLQFKTLKALEGSALTFRLQSNRPLSAGTIEIETAPGEVERVAMQPGAANEVGATVQAAKSGRMKFSIVDVDGHPSAESWEVALTVTHDLAPEVTMKNPDNDAFVAMDFKVEPVAEANDDYGIKTLRIHMARNGTFVEPTVVNFEKPALNARDGFTLDFRQIDVESGDTISYFAEAIDNAPEPHIARSKTVTITVIDTEEYNQYLREQTDISDIEAKYAKLLNEFHDLIEQQKQLGDEIDALKEQLAAAKDDAAREALQKKMDDLLAKQADINKQLNQIAETMENFVRDQPLYDIEAEIKNVLAQRAGEIREATKANEQTREQVAKDAASPQLNQKMLDAMKQASDEQLAKLGAVEEEAGKQVMDALADMSALQEILKDINRFKELYEMQQGVAQQAKAYDRTTPLSREDQLALKDLAAREKMIGDELENVEQRLWEDGKAAENKFPKAGKSAQELAQMMGDLRLRTLAQQTTGAMTAGNGTQGAQLAENLRGEMEKMFSQCNSKGGEMSDELDQRMSIQRSMNPGNSFKQMMQRRKFGSGSKPGQGAMGNGGKDGYVMQSGPNANVLGNEARVSESEKARMNGNGKNKAQPNPGSPEVAIDGTDVVRGMTDTSRESEAIQGETTVDQYRDIVDKYFKAITK